MSFKKGDQLKCVNTGGNPELTNGKVYTAVSDSRAGETRVKSDSGYEYSYYNHRFELVAPAIVDVNDDVIRVGDTVEVKEAGWGVAGDVVGKTGVVLELTNSGWNDVVVCTKDFGTARYGSSQRIALLALKKVKAAIDFTKPLFTAEGTPVQLVSTEGRDPKFPVLVYEGKATNVSKFSTTGVCKLGVARRNLVNTPPAPPEPKEEVRYVNMYETEIGNTMHATRSQADMYAEYHAPHLKRIGVTKLVLTEGKFDA
jgi:hypothetical protein